MTEEKQMSDVKQITLTIDNKQVTVPEGTTIIEASRKVGVSIPHFCWHPGLSVAGVCRLCMVKIEGNPKMQIACNTNVTENMQVFTKAEEALEAQKWALEYQLVNHPLDCPICDQAGECKLQDYYMKVGKYDSTVAENKVLKPKALDVGDNLILDTERCVLCTRCVRFEDEVTKTNSLGIFNRGDHSVIGTYGDKKITHNYSYNLADICPVGAFTAKDFRFQCRVWFLAKSPTICPGCSTGCNVDFYYNKNEREGYRLKPRKNEQVNEHWMCDYGRTMYQHVNASMRIATPKNMGKDIGWPSAVEFLAKKIAEVKASTTDLKINVILSPQYTNEEYAVIFAFIAQTFKVKPQVFIWRDSTENINDFDGILMRGDKHPNTRGLNDYLAENNISAKILAGDFSSLAAYSEMTFVFGPEIEKSYSQFLSDLTRFSEINNLVYFGNTTHKSAQRLWLQVPIRTFAEKSGNYTNFAGITQELTPMPPVYQFTYPLERYLSETLQKGDLSK